MLKSLFLVSLISLFAFSTQASTFTCKSSENWVLNIDTAKKVAEVYDLVSWATLSLTDYGLVKNGNQLGMLYVYKGSYPLDERVKLEVRFIDLDLAASVTARVEDLEYTHEFTCEEVK